jgi:hypothetical protein
VISEEAGYPQIRRRKQLIPRARLVHRKRAEESTSRYVSAVCHTTTNILTTCLPKIRLNVIKNSVFLLSLMFPLLAELLTPVT